MLSELELQEIRRKLNEYSWGNDLPDVCLYYAKKLLDHIDSISLKELELEWIISVLEKDLEENNQLLAYGDCDSGIGACHYYWCFKVVESLKHQLKQRKESSC